MSGSDLFASLRGRKPPQRRRQKQGAGKSLFSALASTQKRRPTQPPQRTVSDDHSIPLPLQQQVRRIADRHAKKSEPRPSHVYADLKKRNPRDPWVAENRGPLLQFARTLLPRQPKTPLTYPPKKRKLWKADKEGRIGIIQAGSDELINRPIAAEAFSGGGLFEIALWVEGVYTAQVCEMDPWAVKTLRLNLHGEAVATDALKWDPKVPQGGLDLLTGGPPCQDFTPARVLGGGVKLVDASPRNMYPRVLDWVADTQPRVVFMENSGAVAVSNPQSQRSSEIIPAPGIPPKSGGRAWQIYNFFVSWWKNLEALGYEGHYYMMYAPDYGTPQHRVRAWVVAWPKGAPWKNELCKLPERTHGYPTSKAVRSGKLLPWVSAFDRLTSGCCGGYGLTDCVNLNNSEGHCFTCIDGGNFHAAPNTSGNQARKTPSRATVDGMADEWEPGKLRIKRIPFIDLTPWNAFAKREPIQQITKNFKVSDWLSRAMVKNALKDEKNILIAPPSVPERLWNNRYSLDYEERREFVEQLVRMSARDMGKIQDVPMWWAFEGGKNAVMSQIGNGIPVNMGRAVARHFMRALKYPVPLPGSYSDAAVEFGSWDLTGLWPYDRLDPCIEFNAPFSYPGGFHQKQYQAKQAGTQGPYRQIGPFDKRKRPVPNLRSLHQYEQKRQHHQQRRLWWSDPSYDGYEKYHWEQLGNHRMTLGKPPPGMGEDFEFADEIEVLQGDWSGYQEAVINHLILAYAEAAMGKSFKGPTKQAVRRGVAELKRAGRGHLGGADWRPEYGVTGWSRFARVYPQLNLGAGTEEWEGP